MWDSNVQVSSQLAQILRCRVGRLWSNQGAIRGCVQGLCRAGSAVPTLPTTNQAQFGRVYPFLLSPRLYNCLNIEWRQPGMLKILQPKGQLCSAKNCLVPMFRNTSECPGSKSKWAKSSHQVQRAREQQRRDDRAGGGWAARLSVTAVHSAGGLGRPHRGNWATSEVQDKGGIRVDVVGIQAETTWH